MILVIAYGINVGIFNAFSTLLNQIVLNYFPVSSSFSLHSILNLSESHCFLPFQNSEQEAGNIGLALILFGMLGSLFLGYLMDSTHNFKSTGMWVCKLTTIAMILFCLALESKSKRLLAIATIGLGLA